MRLLLLLLAAVLALPACGSDASAGAMDVEGEWQLHSGTVDGETLPQPDGTTATLALTGDEARGRSFCNHWFATARVEGTSVSFDGIGGTEMGCDPDVMSAETAFLAALGVVTTVARDGEDLVLTGNGVELRFTRVEPIPDRRLTGTRWVLESLFDGETASSTVGEPAVLHLAEDGTFEGSTGCRALSGTWTTSGDTVMFPDLRADGDCATDAVRQDSHVVEVLGDGFRVHVQAGRLTAANPNGLGLVYRAET
ncbi:META domain-containing protein [Blastococcus sp. CCUG 61487]|uniref:META domain-containing protein n=1 Tax=Blastococcus sp. CCUG 61487 TaxID=1840703 RepID=UPI0010BF7CC9|nr:META domain-containing protein [Blastococcus sp. CCUG 61487]TKJ24521.1 hypothetical protein A6V29_04770 [Blastococcus sp. CCUG 61487]